MAVSGLTFVNGSDMLLYVGGKAIGHCTSHTVSISTTTKERTFKATASTARAAALWTSKGVTGLACTISAEGLCFYNETENGYNQCLPLVTAGSEVEVKCVARPSSGVSGSSPTAWLTGNFVITKLDRTDPANDDSTYSIELENSGAPTITQANITPAT